MRHSVVGMMLALPLILKAQEPSDWEKIFNGKDLDGWVVKLAHHNTGENFGDTFRVDKLGKSG